MQPQARRALISSVALLISSCLPPSGTGLPSAQSSGEAGCEGSGIVQAAAVPDTQRGYPYTFNVYLPAWYEADREREYPVLYLVPGRGSGPAAWFASGAAEAADAAIHAAGVPPFIIVATENTDVDPYADAIVNELIPFVEANYRVRAGRAYRAVAGGSLGGIAAYRIAFQHPDQFASSAVFGSGLVAGEEALFSAWLGALPEASRPRVFLNTGEQDPYMLERARVLQAMLDEAGLEATLIVGPGGHDYVYWISNFPAYFSWLAQDW